MYLHYTNQYVLTNLVQLVLQVEIASKALIFLSININIGAMYNVVGMENFTIFSHKHNYLTKTLEELLSSPFDQLGEIS